MNTAKFKFERKKRFVENFHIIQQTYHLKEVSVHTLLVS